MKPDGVFFSNGPGDPGPCDYAISAATEIIEQGVPTFGICLGHQIMGLGCWREDLENEIRSSRRKPPSKDLDSGRVAITSQNHGFAVDAKTLPSNVRVTHVSLVRWLIAGPWRGQTSRLFVFRGIPRHRQDPTTSLTYSITLWT